MAEQVCRADVSDNLHWKCSCGKGFPEQGRKDPGNCDGWEATVLHLAGHRRKGDVGPDGTPEEIEGLYEAETGRRVFKGPLRHLAVTVGILPSSPPGSASQAFAQNR